MSKQRSPLEGYLRGQLAKITDQMNEELLRACEQLRHLNNEMPLANPTAIMDGLVRVKTSILEMDEHTKRAYLRLQELTRELDKPCPSPCTTCQG